MSAAPGPLASVTFRFLLSARTVLVFGNAMAPVALAFAVIDIGGGAGALGLVVASRSITNVALLLMGGVVADRLPRGLVLVGSSTAGAITQAVVATTVLTGTANIPLLCVLSAVNGAVTAISLPASSALTPETVPSDLLQQANALLRLSINSSTVLGASLGGIICAAIGPGWGLAVDAATFGVAALLFSGVRGELPKSDGSVWRELRTGWTEFRSRRWVVAVVVQFAAVNAAFVGSVGILAPVLFDQSHGRLAYGFMIAAQTAGFVGGAIVAYKMQLRHPLRVGVALTLFTALPAFALATTDHLLLILSAAFIAGFAMEQFAVYWDLSLQQNVPKAMLARVYSYDAVGSFAAVPLGEATAGGLAELVGVRTALLGCAAVIAVATVLALTQREVREVRDTAPSKVSEV